MDRNVQHGPEAKPPRKGSDATTKESAEQGVTMIDASEFRRVMGHFATGVTIVTTRQGDGSPCGLTVNAFVSVSLDPTLVLVSVEHASDSHECIRESGVYAVNVLEDGKGEALSRRFATWGVNDKFRGVAYREGKTGAAILDAALSWVECEVRQAISIGDHTLFVGEVVDADVHEGRPLVYYRGGYGRFDP